MLKLRNHDSKRAYFRMDFNSPFDVLVSMITHEYQKQCKNKSSNRSSKEQRYQFDSQLQALDNCLAEYSRTLGWQLPGVVKKWLKSKAFGLAKTVVTSVILPAAAISALPV